MAESLSQNFRSFIAVALALKPALKMHSHTGGANATLTISATEQLSETEIASLEPLMTKYKPLQPYLDGVLRSDLSFATSTHTVTFSPNVQYRLVRVTEEQFNLAKEVATRLGRISVAHEANDHKLAKTEYDSFHQFLEGQREILTGEFRGIHFSNAVANYGSLLPSAPPISWQHQKSLSSLSKCFSHSGISIT